ncbi:MAG: RsmE family RNA methyltransferase [bacterium]
MNHPEKHMFALYVRSLSSMKGFGRKMTEFELHDKELWHRLTRTLRLTAGETVTFFDSILAYDVRLSERMFSDKKLCIHGTVIQCKENEPLAPLISLYICMPKKSTFEEICYTAAQMGVTSIVPVLSEKSQKISWTEKEHTRLERIMIAACEQSKQFVLPSVASQCLIYDIPSNDALKLFFDAHGQNISSLVANLANASHSSIAVVIGPEGGLTRQEQDVLQKNGFLGYALTPTILRTQDAMTVGLGILRSIS